MLPLGRHREEPPKLPHGASSAAGLRQVSSQSRRDELVFCTFRSVWALAEEIEVVEGCKVAQSVVRSGGLSRKSSRPKLLHGSGPRGSWAYRSCSLAGAPRR